MTDPLRYPPTLSYAAAAQMVAVAMEHAKANGWTVAVAVIDHSGAMICAGRMDGGSPTVLDIAIDKGFTATLGRSTDAFGKHMLSDAQLTLGASNRPRMVAWEGGLPIRSDGILVGGIGISGAAGHEDAECARAALDVFGFTG